jgi:signal transduction histidine kinase
MKKFIMPPALRLALTYLLISIAWILFSDAAVAGFVTDPNVMNNIQSAKGIGFVIATAILLWWLICRELKAREKVERQLRILNLELEQRVDQRTAELTAANERLQELDSLKSKFIADVTHDLRNPVTSLNMRIDLLERATPDKREKYIADLKLRAVQLKTLVDDVLDISRLDVQEAPKMRFAPVDLNQVVEQALVIYQPLAEESDLHLLFEPLPTLPPVAGEYNQLSRLVTNLIANAINYTDTGEIRICTGLSEIQQRGYIAVQDTGRGIDEQDVPHLFKRFYRGKQTDTQTAPGTGLGLSIVDEIARLHGGEVTLESQLGVGSTFTVSLPLTETPR